MNTKFDSPVMPSWFLLQVFSIKFNGNDILPLYRQKDWHHLWFFSLSLTPIHLQILSAVSSKHIQNPIISSLLPIRAWGGLLSRGYLEDKRWGFSLSQGYLEDKKWAVELLGGQHKEDSLLHWNWPAHLHFLQAKHVHKFPRDVGQTRKRADAMIAWNLSNMTAQRSQQASAEKL